MGMLIIQIMLSKLDEKTHHDWEKHAEKSKSHSIDELVKFLHTQSRVLDAVTEERIPIGKQKKTMERHLAMNVASKIQKCAKCGEQHHLKALFGVIYFEFCSLGDCRQLTAVNVACGF